MSVLEPVHLNHGSDKLHRRPAVSMVSAVRTWPLIICFYLTGLPPRKIRDHPEST
jgi:hypothetical protein